MGVGRRDPGMRQEYEYFHLTVNICNGTMIPIEEAIDRIPRVTKDNVDRLTSLKSTQSLAKSLPSKPSAHWSLHKRQRQHLEVLQPRPTTVKIIVRFLYRLPGRFLSQPSDVTHRCFHALHSELILIIRLIPRALIP